MKVGVLLCLLCVSFCSAEVFFQEDFTDGYARWVVSKFKQADAGEFGISAGKYFNDAEADKGLRTTQDARFYQISAEMKEFSNRGKTLILQYTIKHEQNIDCGGGYIKVLPAGLDQENFNGDSPYNIMFGPDICGTTKKVHVIFNYKGKNHLIKHEIPCKSDELTHLYTLIVKPDQTFQVLIDNKEVKKGTLPDSWDFLPPKEIKDPSVSKPADWVDQKEIDDPNAVKPAGWDEIPKQIPDPNAAKPDDWDNELDGEWEAPLIDNPEFKGEWKAPKIPNPAYKGEWVHPLIPNPEYAEDNEIYAYDSNKYVGIEIWQVKSGTIFDNIIVTDDESVAQEWAEKFAQQQKGEKEAYDQAQKTADKKEEKDDNDEDEDDKDDDNHDDDDDDDVSESKDAAVHDEL
jgi:calreticulin